jgi:hypothetical protein
MAGILDQMAEDAVQDSTPSMPTIGVFGFDFGQDGWKDRVASS